jgi:hypothetical protein
MATIVATPSGRIGRPYLNERNKMTLNKWIIKYSSGAYVTPANGDIPLIFNTRREALHESGKYFDAAPCAVTFSIEEEALPQQTLTLKKRSID